MYRGKEVATPTASKGDLCEGQCNPCHRGKQGFKPAASIDHVVPRDRA